MRKGEKLTIVLVALVAILAFVLGKARVNKGVQHNGVEVYDSSYINQIGMSSDTIIKDSTSCD